MDIRNPDLRARLLAMADRDLRVRAELAAAGALSGGYHPAMQSVHDANASELDILLSGVWASIHDVGRDGQDAAWMIVQHAIGRPEFQRRYLKAAKLAVAQGLAPGWQAAMLEDRVRYFEGGLQIYGTQFEWDDEGLMSPVPIEDPAGVDARRLALGLEPLAEALARVREGLEIQGQVRPLDSAKRRAEFAVWAEAAGWRR